MTCKDCIHVEMCHMERCYQDYRFEHRDKIETYCEEFKNKADFEQVVRCEDCKYWENGKDYEPYCNHFGNMMTDTTANDFCSYGVRESTE